MAIEIKPHLLHATLDAEGYLIDWSVDCPYDPTDPQRPCLMVEGEGSSVPIDGCAGKDWLDGIGAEMVSAAGRDPSFPLPCDVAWGPGAEYAELVVRDVTDDRDVMAARLTAAHGVIRLLTGHVGFDDGIVWDAPGQYEEWCAAVPVTDAEIVRLAATEGEENDGR